MTRTLGRTPFRAAYRYAKLTLVRERLRTRPLARPLTRAAVVTALAAAVAVAVNACGAVPTAPPAPRPLTAPPELPLSLLPAPPAEAPATTVLLPIPIAIPFDSYAPEPVVEIGTIEIPAIGLDHRLFQGVTLHNIDQGPSHWPGTALPGQAGNAVFAGHRVTHSHPFLRVDELEAGDLVIFRVDGVRSTYQVTNSMVVLPEDTWIADQSPEATATLYACHPPGSAAQRYVVQMALVSTGPET